MRIDRVKLIAEMARQEITSLDLSKKAGVSRSSISAMRSGKRCNQNTAQHVARALGVDLETIMEEE